MISHTFLISVIDTHAFYICGIPPYLFMAGCGFFFAFSTFLLLSGRTAVPVNSCGKLVLLSLPGLLVGAKLFGVISKVLYLIGQHEPVTFRAVASSGIVFYGGLTGLVLSFLLLQKKILKQQAPEVTNIFAVCIPLFHAFARCGCFLSGCCYGIQSSFLAIPYILPDEDIVVSRFPVQLAEAGVNLILFAVLLVLLLRKSRLHLLPTYLIMYSVCRFVMEFFRGDPIRGVFGGISFSQIYSILVFAAALFLLHVGGKKHEAVCSTV